jgi:putative toxin-antitoxin system antitoxin component (TIGR02293 family)
MIRGEKMNQPECIVEVMGIKAILRRPIRSMDDLETTVSMGLPKQALKNTVARIFLNSDDVRRVMNEVVPSATYKRRAKLLSPAESERTERMARIIAAAEFALSSKAGAREWLTKPHPELRMRPPIDVAATELGARRVEDLLNRILFGIPS